MWTPNCDAFFATPKSFGPDSAWQTTAHLQIRLVSTLQRQQTWLSPAVTVTVIISEAVPAHMRDSVAQKLAPQVDPEAERFSVAIAAHIMGSRAQQQQYLGLSLGCFLGGVAPSTAPTPVTWLRLSDPSCVVLAVKSPREEGLWAWLRALVAPVATGAETAQALSGDWEGAGTQTDLALRAHMKREDNEGGTLTPGPLPPPPAPAEPEVQLPRRLQNSSNTAIVLPWSWQAAEGTLAGLPPATLDAITIHWGLTLCPRRSLLPFIRQCARLLKPGGLLRIVEPDYATYPTPARRWAENSSGYIPHSESGATATPASLTAALERAGLRVLSTVGLDESAHSNAAVGAAAVLDTVDGEDVRLWTGYGRVAVVA